MKIPFFHRSSLSNPEKTLDNNEIDKQEKLELEQNELELPQSIENNNVLPSIAIIEVIPNNEINHGSEDSDGEGESKMAMSMVHELTNTIDEFKKLSRQYYLNTSAVQDNSIAVKELDNNLQHSKGELIEIKKYLEQILINLRQENGELKREIKEWQQTAIDFFQLFERALDYEKEENQKLIERILNEYARTVSVRGLDRIIPQPGEPMTEKFHEAVAEEVSDIEPGDICKCNRWGYRIGSNVLEKAKVFISKSQIQENEHTISPSTNENIPIEVVVNYEIDINNQENIPLTTSTDENFVSAEF